MKKRLLILFTCFITSPLLAESLTNQELLKACKDKGIGPQNFCYGFIISAANAAQFYRNITDIEDEYIDICFPTNISNKEIVDLYITWIEKNPSLGKSPAFVGVSSSFSTKYSCPSKKTEKKKAE
ncbi:MAG: hypothetical protein K2P93_04830 [Alphaproteobacteria bacterium]|nr:hypothetical protein [Alphaproteobacteria bacterium]